MSITKISEPAAGQSLQDDLYHVVASDASGTTDMRYVFDVYVNGEQKIRAKQYPNPTTGLAYFDAGPIVRNSVSYQWFKCEEIIYPSGQPSVSGDIALTYRVEYGEDVSGVTTTNMASGEITAYNYIPSLYGRRRQNLLVYKLNKFLTNRPLMAKSSLNENFYIGLYTEDYEIEMTIKKYGWDGSLIDTEVLTEVVTNSGFKQLNIGSKAINATLATNFIDENVRYYTVEFLQKHEMYTVYMNCNGRYSPVLLHFLNNWGMFDTAKFGLASRLNMDSQQKGFEKSDAVFTWAGVSYYDGKVYNESKINNSITKNWSMRLTMDAPTDAEASWLHELITSAQIYAEIDGYFYPVTMKTTAYEYSQYVNNRLKPLEIEISLNQTRYSHLR